MKQTEDLSGQKFGKWTVLKRGSAPSNIKSHHAFWTCQCECGTIRDVDQTNLKLGKTVSCGCS